MDKCNDLLKVYDGYVKCEYPKDHYGRHAMRTRSGEQGEIDVFISWKRVKGTHTAPCPTCGRKIKIK